MKQMKGSFLLILLLTFGVYFMGAKLIPEFEDTAVSNEHIQLDMVIPGGIPVGIYMDTNGVLVIDTTSIEVKNGDMVSPANKLLQEGDYIIAFNGTEIETKKKLLDMVGELNGETVTLKIRREDKEFEIKITPALTPKGTYMLGVWVRDNLQGLGTLTYMNVNGGFGALGHGIHDIDTNELLEISDGKLYKASVSGIIPGESGAPGGLEGVIIYSPLNQLGCIKKNSELGIYGTIEYVESLGVDMEPVEVACTEEIRVGKASILCTIDDEVEEYDILVTKVDMHASEANKGLVIQVVDEELLGRTGGIVQGMSGSPVLQDEKLIGAVTHVFVNDPTRGYGIFIENMLETAEGVE